VGEDCAEEIYVFTNFVDILNQEILAEEIRKPFFQFNDIIPHQDLLKPGDCMCMKPGDCMCKRSMWNVMVALEDGTSETYELLHLMPKISPVNCCMPC